MAATAVYYCVSRIPLIKGDADDATFTGTVSVAADSATFHLEGGLYGIDVKASTYGTVTLKKQAQDGTTYLTVLTAFSADGYATAYLSQGTYKIVVA